MLLAVLTLWVIYSRAGLKPKRRQSADEKNYGIPGDSDIVGPGLSGAGPARLRRRYGAWEAAWDRGLYNPQTVTTVKGTVEKLEEINMGRGGGMGMKFREIILKTDKGSLMVHLGPSQYLDQQKFAVKVGDTVEVTGSQVTLNNQPAIIAREVKVNGQTLKLRDDQGIPAWRGMGRGSGMGPGGGQGRSPRR